MGALTIYEASLEEYILWVSNTYQFKSINGFIYGDQQENKNNSHARE